MKRSVLVAFAGGDTEQAMPKHKSITQGAIKNPTMVLSSIYGWTGQRSSSGFFDLPPATLGVFASLDRF
jgi:hypothetical protein